MNTSAEYEILECNAKFYYHVNLDERGLYYADVRNSDGNTVFEIGDDFYPISDIIEDGFMRHTEDMDGLCDYLTKMNVMPEGAKLIFIG